MTRLTGLTGLLIADVDGGCCRRGVVRFVPPSLHPSLLSFPFCSRSHFSLVLVLVPVVVPVPIAPPFSSRSHFVFVPSSSRPRSRFVPVFPFCWPCSRRRCLPFVVRSIRSSPPIVVQPSSCSPPSLYLFAFLHLSFASANANAYVCEYVCVCMCVAFNARRRFAALFCVLTPLCFCSDAVVL